MVGSGLGWWLAIALIAAIREKITVSDVVPALKGMGITFIMSGLMSMAFMGFTGIKLAKPGPETGPYQPFPIMEPMGLGQNPIQGAPTEEKE